MHGSQVALHGGHVGLPGRGTLLAPRPVGFKIQGFTGEGHLVAHGVQVALRGGHVGLPGSAAELQLLQRARQRAPLLARRLRLQLQLRAPRLRARHLLRFSPEVSHARAASASLA